MRSLLIGMIGYQIPCAITDFVWLLGDFYPQYKDEISFDDSSIQINVVTITLFTLLAFQRSKSILFLTIVNYE